MPPLDMKLPEKEANALLLVMEILLAGIAVILLLLISCLFAPLAYELDLAGAQLSLQFHLVFHNVFCGMSIRLTAGNLDWYLRILGKRIVHRQKATSPESDKSPVTHKSPESSSHSSRTTRTSSPSLLHRAISDVGLREQILNLIVTIWQKLKPHYVTVIARIGFSEPHYTGWIMALAAMLQINNHDYTIQIEGIWNEPCLEGALNLAGKIVPGMILWYILKFLLDPEIRPYYRKLRAQTISRTQAA